MNVPIPWLNTLLINDPLTTKAYLLLLLAVISLWLSRRTLYWSLMLGFAVTAAMMANRITVLGLISAVTTGIVCYAYYRSVALHWRLLFGFSSLGLLAALAAHGLPGFYNWKVLDQVLLSPQSTPYNLFLNFDKPLVGLFVIGFGGLISLHRRDWYRPLGYGIGAGLMAAVLILGAVTGAGLIAWQPKVPEFLGLWMVVNLLSTCVAEEALFRGFVQTELSRIFPQRAWIPIGTAAVLFGLMHFSGGLSYIAVATIAGFVYSWVYWKTRSLEASILCHFTLNLIHLLAFSYPRLAV